MKKIKWITAVIASSSLIGSIIPLLTTASCSNAGSLTKEEQLFLNEVNYVCSKHEDLVTCHKAVTTVGSYGFDIVNYKLNNPNHYFAYDIYNQRFIVMNGDALVSGPEGYSFPNNTQSIFRFVSSTTITKNSKFSQYLKYELSYDTTTEQGIPVRVGYPKEIEVSTGLDCGYNTTIETITYTGNNLQQQIVVLNTYCDILHVNAGDDTVYHYGTANDIYVTNSDAYYEYGEEAYLYAEKSSLGFGYVDNNDHCSIDILEVKDSDSKLISVDDDIVILSSVGIWWDQLAGIAYNLSKDSGYQFSVTKPSELIYKPDGVTKIRKGFLRLQNDITFTDDTQWTIEPYTDESEEKNMQIILDLNGHSILESGTALDAGKPRILVKGSNDLETTYKSVSLTIVDSKRGKIEDNNCISFTDHPIQVNGGTSRPGILTLDGADILYHSSAQDGAAIVVGDERTTETASQQQWAYLYLYGGCINAYKKADSAAAGILVRGIGSFLEGYYGYVIAESACIAGQDDDERKYNDTRIDITGGHLLTKDESGKTNDKGVCLYLPQSGVTNIDGGSFEGGLPIGFKAGNININGGYFDATGAYKQTPVEKSQGFDIDGSVIMFEASVDKTAPILSVTNGVMTSENSNIFSVVSDDAGESYLGLLTAHFFDGNYLYKKTPFDIHNFNSKKYYIHQTGGTWSKIAD